MRDHTDDTRSGGGLPPAPDWAVPGCERRSVLVAGLLEAMDQKVGVLFDLDPTYLGTTDKRDLLVALTRLETRVTAAKLHLIAGADDVAEADGARDVAAWLTNTCQVDRTTARREQRLAKTLATRRPALADGLARGEVSLEQAQVIATGLDKLPADVPADTVTKAEEHLVAQAADHPPRELRILTRRVLDVVAPDLGEEQERIALEAEEADARKKTRLFTRSHGDGTTSVIARVPDLVASRLLTHLQAYLNPRRPDGGRGLDTGLVPRPGSTTEGPDGGCGLDTGLVPRPGSTTEGPDGGCGLDTGLVPRPGSTTEGPDGGRGLDTGLVPRPGSTTEGCGTTTGDHSVVEPASAASGVETTTDRSSGVETTSDGEPTPYDVRLGHAFCSLLEHLDPHRLPIHGGDATNVVVTIDHDTLRTGLGLATTSTGEVITAGEARRLACTAGILPAVLDGNTRVLDLGRTQRLFTPAQRKALAIRDRHCRTDGCDIPAAWCEAHHETPWSQGGKTDLDNAVLYCSFHHHRAHDPTYQRTKLPNGDHRFHRRT